MAHRTMVLGIGNTFMGDDGVGAVVARLVREQTHETVGAEIMDRPNADIGVLSHFRGTPRIIVIDAIDIGAEPGSVYRFTPDDAGITSLRSNNIHGMGVGNLVAYARLAGADPEVIIYGIQVGDVRPNPDTLTPEVAQAAQEVAAMVEHELEHPHPPGPRAARTHPLNFEKQP